MAVLLFSGETSCGPKQFSLTIDVQGGGYTNLGGLFVNPTVRTYSKGTQLTLVATPTYGFIFDSWSGDADGFSMSITIIMNSDKVITANFKEPPDVFSQIAEGQGINNASFYGTKKGIPPTVFLNKNPIYGSNHWYGGIDGFDRREVPTEWQAQSVSEAELVALFKVRSRELVQDCGLYLGGCHVNRYRTVVDVELREARTGKVIGNKTIYSAEPRSCQFKEYSCSIYGILLWNQVEDWLRLYVN